jgi:hypothetical protein
MRSASHRDDLAHAEAGRDLLHLLDDREPSRDRVARERTEGGTFEPHVAGGRREEP